MRKLILGIVDFRERMLPQYAQRQRRKFEVIDRDSAEQLIYQLHQP